MRSEDSEAGDGEGKDKEWGSHSAYQLREKIVGKGSGSLFGQRECNCLCNFAQINLRSIGLASMGWHTGVV